MLFVASPCPKQMKKIDFKPHFPFGTQDFSDRACGAFAAGMRVKLVIVAIDGYINVVKSSQFDRYHFLSFCQTVLSTQLP